jgi:hypothetical protein
MAWTIVLVLLALWMLGIATSYTLGGLLHIFLVVAVAVGAIRLIEGRKVL